MTRAQPAGGESRANRSVSGPQPPLYGPLPVGLDDRSQYGAQPGGRAGPVRGSVSGGTRSAYRGDAVKVRTTRPAPGADDPYVRGARDPAGVLDQDGDGGVPPRRLRHSGGDPVEGEGRAAGEQGRWRAAVLVTPRRRIQNRGQQSLVRVGCSGLEKVDVWKDPLPRAVGAAALGRGGPGYAHRSQLAQGGEVSLTAGEGAEGGCVAGAGIRHAGGVPRAHVSPAASAPPAAQW